MMDKKNTLFWWCFLLGVSSLILGITTGVPAIICGHKSLRNFKESEGKRTKKEFILAIVGLCLAYLSTVLSLIFLMLFVYSDYKI